MALNRAEQERLTDSRSRIQSVVSALRAVDPKKVPHIEEIQACLEEAQESISTALEK